MCGSVFKRPKSPCVGRWGPRTRVEAEHQRGPRQILLSQHSGRGWLAAPPRSDLGAGMQRGLASLTTPDHRTNPSLQWEPMEGAAGSLPQSPGPARCPRTSWGYTHLSAGSFPRVFLTVTLSLQLLFVIELNLIAMDKTELHKQ